MRSAAERREINNDKKRRKREQKQRHQLRMRQRKERKKETKVRKKEEVRARKQEKRDNALAARANISQGEENFFNGISAITHALATRTLSNLRLSLGLRISWNYAKRLVKLMWREIFIVLLVFCIGEWFILAKDANVIAQNGYKTNIPAITASVEPANATQTEWLGKTQRYLGGLCGASMDQWLLNELLFSAQTTADGVLLLVRYDITWHMLGFLGILALIALINLSSALWFMLTSREINRSVLSPIGQITETAQMLSENDLGRRINVEGTNNELKDLAHVINDMLDRLELAYNAQKQFVSDASHELRTPIAVVQGYANLLNRWGKDSPEVRDEAIAAILSESASMKELVEKLLFLARHDKHTMRLKPDRFDIRDLVDESVRETQLITSERNVCSDVLQNAMVFADRAALKQTIRVFIDNAVKYTPVGGTITIACQREGDRIAVSVTDTGVGIAKSELNAIFERFYRADTARSGEVPGHGLGLSIAKIIILGHGGKIRVRSKSGIGSTFTMLLPIVP